MENIIDFLTHLKGAGLDAKDVEAFFALSGSEKARIAAAMVAVMKAPSDSGQTVVMHPSVPVEKGNRRVYTVKSSAVNLADGLCSSHSSWPRIGTVALGTEMYLGEIGDVSPRQRLATPAEMLWFLGAAKPRTSFIGEGVEVHDKGYQLLLKLRNDGSWSKEFGPKGDGHYPALLVQLGEDYTI